MLKNAPSHKYSIFGPFLSLFKSLCRQLGANVILHGKSFGHAKSFAMHLAKNAGAVYVNGYDHPHILAGQGSMGIEILEEVPDVDYIICPIGGGGLIAGITSVVKSLRPTVKIIGVESKKTPSWHTALKNKKPIACQHTIKHASETIADGLSVPTVGVNAFHTAKDLIEKVIEIDETWIAVAITRLLESEKAVVEGAGASGLAAILSGQLPELEGKKCVVVLCGGNIDISTLGRVVERGLLATGRLIKFTVTVSDRVGGLQQFINICSEIGISIKTMHQDPASSSSTFKVKLSCTAETRDESQEPMLRKSLAEVYGEEEFQFMEFKDEKFHEVGFIFNK